MQCKHTGTRGQCKQPTIYGSEYCRKHTNEEDRLNMYRINDPQIRERFERHSKNNSLDSLKQEVILIRALIEERINLASNDHEKIQAINHAVTSLATIDKLVNSLSKLQRLESLVLDKEALQRLKDRIIDILTKNLSDVPGRDKIVDNVAREIAAAIIETRNEL